jgi:Zn-dependent peptidase ImmA (M78 family)
MKIFDKISEFRNIVNSEVINPIDFAKYENVRIMQNDFSNYKKSLLGYYAKDNNGVDIICFRKGISVEQIRKVVAHELCHVFLNSNNITEAGVIDLYDSEMKYNQEQMPIEYVCEKGAREILMPKDTFIKIYNDLRLRERLDNLIISLSNIFAVEPNEIRTRINDFGLEC